MAFSQFSDPTNYRTPDDGRPYDGGDILTTPLANAAWVFITATPAGRFTASDTGEYQVIIQNTDNPNENPRLINRAPGTEADGSIKQQSFYVDGLSPDTDYSIIASLNATPAGA